MEKEYPSNSTGTPVAFQTGALVTSTPFDGERITSFGSTSKKADVSQLFQNIGSKLGWFDHGDLDMALKKLSKSSKKKSNKSKLEKDIDDSKVKSAKRSTKEKHKKSTKSSTSNKENEKKSNQVKSSLRDGSPFKEIINNDSLDDFKDIPLERKPARTDLTSRHKKKSHKVKNDSSSSTTDSQSESPSFDFGKPIKESTRIHSRKSIDNILDATNISEVSADKSGDSSNNSGDNSYKQQVSTNKSVGSLNNSGDDSYKQLHINQRNSHKTESEMGSVNDDICVGIHALDIQAQSCSKGNNSNSSDSRNEFCNQLYVTALEKSISEESFGNDTQNSNASASKLKNRNVYVEHESTNSLNSCKRKKREKTHHLSMSDRKNDSLNSSSSYFEVKDVSVQAGQEAAEIFQTENGNCSRILESSSVIEVKDVSQQTSLSLTSPASDLSVSSSIPCKNNNNFAQNLPTENITDISEEGQCKIFDDSSSFVQVQDTSAQIDSSDRVSFEVKNDTCDVNSSSSTDVKMAEKTQYFDFSNNSFKSESSKGSNNSSVKSDFSVKNKINETKYFSDDGDDALPKIDDGNVTKSFSDSDQFYNLDQTKYLSGESDDLSTPDIDQENNVTKSFSDSDQVVSIQEQTRYFSGGNESSRSLNSTDDPEVCNGSNQQCNITDKTRYFDFSSDENVFSENEESCKEQTDKISDENSCQKDTKTKCNFVDISSDEELNCDLIRNKTKKFHKNSVTRTSERDNERKSSNSKHLDDDDLNDSLPDPSMSMSHNKPKWRKTNGYHSDSSSSDDNLEQFFQKMKTPAKAKKNSSDSSDRHNNSMADFIVNDSDISSEDEDDDCFYLSTNSKLDLDRKNESVYIIDDEDNRNTDDSEDSLFSSSSDSDKDFKKEKPKTSVKPVEKNVRRTEKTVCSGERNKILSREKTIKSSTSYHKPNATERKYSFLKSLSVDLPENKCDPEALRYVKTFKKNKDELLKKLFRMYNETVFDHKLPRDLEIVWNKRLLQTAGYCTYKRNVKCASERTVRLELSVKVCDTAERVRDTLIHELCHAAVWLLNGKSDGHGPYWKYWARKANLAHPELPVIARCHTYQITYKYTYVCSGCGYSIGRHSKSLDTTRKVCGHCHSHFVLRDSNTYTSSDTAANQPKTPRNPNRFAMFVKENYGNVKKTDKNLKHKEIMNVLSKQFAEKNKISV